MRFSPIVLLVGASSLVRAEGDADAALKVQKGEPTTFNGVEVPPFLELTPSNIAEEMKNNKFLMVKHYRYCGDISCSSRANGLTI